MWYGGRAWLKTLKSRDVGETWGVEPNEKAAAMASAVVTRVLCGPIESVWSAISTEHFGCLLCLDVLEHLPDPWAVMRRLIGLCKPNATIIVSLPNLRYWEVLRDLVFHREFSYREQGILDQTHLQFFTSKSAVDLISSAGGKEVRLWYHPRKLGGGRAVINLCTGGVVRDIFAWQLLVSARA